MNNRILAMTAISVTLSLNACTTHRTAQFGDFAKAGAEYADAMSSLTVEAGNTAIDTDSDILLLMRERLGKPERQQHYREHTSALKGLLAQQQELKRHTLLLKNYFLTLARMAGSDTPERLGKEARRLAESISALSAGMGNASSGNSAIAASAAGTVTPLVVAAFRQKALEEELRSNGPTIERELELQQSALQAISGQMRADIAASAGIQEYALVMKPYDANLPIPENWKISRRQLFETNRTIESIDAAAAAAGKLRKSFKALAEGTLTVSDLDDLLQDIDAIGGLLAHKKRGG